MESILTILIVLFSASFVHLVGAITAVRAIMTGRTSQGATAWSIALVSFPYLAIPAYWFLGRSKFFGYVNARRAQLENLDPIGAQIRSDLIEGDLLVTPLREDRGVYEKIANLPLTQGNSAQLLIDGKVTFDAIIEAIEQAKSYILVEFFIVKHDGVGTRLKDALIKKASDGVRVYFIYDEIGSHKLSRKYKKQLRNAGASIIPFNSRKGLLNRFQVNFRNHRKIVVVDGHTALVGGHNIGDEYLGLSKKFGAWRDTHVEIEGPAALMVQAAFAEDWNWAAGEILRELNWSPQVSATANQKVLCLPTGPADSIESCTMFFLHAINSAKSRIWIASPYFVPDEQVMSALQLAVLRGVDVRILIPDDPDHILVYLSAFSYLPMADQAGIALYRYTAGFMHQKVLLVDDRYSAVGTANLDNRSFRLNFEITMLIDDFDFAAEVEKMLETDFDRSRLFSSTELEEKSYLFRFAVKFARLMAPIQ